MAIEQSGNVTPGHLATWTTNGVLQDGGVVRSSNTVLAYILSANFNSILDQSLQLSNLITAFQITSIVVTNPTASFTTASGGVYPTTAKGGTAIVAAGQVYTTLTAATKLLALTLAAGVATTRYSSANVDVVDGYPTIYLSLSVGQGIECTADVYLFGNDLSV